MLPPRPEDKQIDRQAQERERVQALGMTEAEAKAWVATAEAAGAFFALPELHPMDRQEVATALHVVQNKLLSRPVYPQYLARARQKGSSLPTVWAPRAASGPPE